MEGSWDEIELDEIVVNICSFPSIGINLDDEEKYKLITRASVVKTNATNSININGTEPTRQKHRLTDMSDNASNSDVKDCYFLEIIFTMVIPFFCHILKLVGIPKEARYDTTDLVECLNDLLCNKKKD
ncbi:hypothetical protein Glove_123g101 [Diversispora epigaea]|uniref:Uncharacterized protein n=1 Tax=Diversispora epigaea TaxID=1348612 RepID=A0A397IYR9_9GLOM|nr:hypothetical protein Glove_123g101 [Diversispora epigaea]